MVKRKLTEDPEQTAAAGQYAVAMELGVEVPLDSDSRMVVELLEKHLGDNALREQARWFVLSVLQHQRQVKWHSSAQSGVSPEQQYELADQCLSHPQFVQSLKIVLKDDGCKYCLIEFGRSRHSARRILSNSTVAFQYAEQVIEQARLATPTVLESGPDQQPTISLRRAHRRGFVPESEATNHEADSQPRASTAATDEPQLSAHEVEELERLLTQQPDSHTSGRWRMMFRGFGSDESRSWLTGVCVGLAVFVLFLLFSTQA